MGYTNFPNGITSLGIPLPGVMPSIAGKWFFVNGAYGSDSNKGTSISKPLKTLSKAYALCTSGAGDGICIISTDTGTSASTTVYETAKIDWSKSSITVFGMCAPTHFGQRARIANASTATGLAYIVDVQGHNNAFYNIQFANWGTDNTALSAVKVSGNRNYFQNCYFVNAGYVAGENLRDLWLTGSDNHFEDCSFGVCTVETTGATRCNVMLNGDGSTTCAETLFRNCRMYIYSQDNTQGSVRSYDANSCAGIILFENCTFMAAPGSTAEPSYVFIGTAPTALNAILFVKDCWRFNIGASGWSNKWANLFVGAGANVTNAAAGLASYDASS